MRKVDRYDFKPRYCYLHRFNKTSKLTSASACETVYMNDHSTKTQNTRYFGILGILSQESNSYLFQ